MNLNEYYTRTGVMALLLSPMAVSVGLLGVTYIVPPILTLALVWVLYAAKASLPEKASEIFLPIFLAFGYYMCLWIAVFDLSGYRFDSDLFGGFFSLLTAPYFVFNFFFSITRDFTLFPLVNAAIFTITVLSIVITRAICKKKIIWDRKAIVLGLIFIFLSGVAGFQYHERSTQFLNNDSYAERIDDEVNLDGYRPFRENNLLKRLHEPAAISFHENYPKLDGATAAYPVYGAMAQELYKGLNEWTVAPYVACSKTDEAYERLIQGEIDIFFGAQPSEQQLASAKEKGVELVLTPIAKEAFVFFVNKENPVGALTVEQIQNIYQKRIVNWKTVGGKNEKILPFQRPENSGSQTIMRAMVMRNKPLPAPLWEEYSAGMGEMISQIAIYRNYSSSIGYSFRYFATGMNPNENIKLLAINGIEPTVENIRNGTYPFAIDVYAVTAGSKNENTEKLIEWILSPQGQSLVEKTGYVPMSN